MEARAVLKRAHVSPRKARLVVDLIRGRKVEEALHILKFTRRRAAKIVEKVLKSALANATNKEIGDVDVLKVSRAFVDGGQIEKRIQPTAMGRAWAIHKRMSHITIVLAPPVGPQKASSGTVEKKSGQPVKKSDQAGKKTGQTGKKAGQTGKKTATTAKAKS
jgi:large subunit ribosomal protein L22